MGGIGDAFKSIGGVLGAPFTGGMSLIPGMASGGGGGLKNFFLGKQAGVQDPFGQADRPFANFTEDAISRLFGNPNVSAAYGTNPLESSAAQGLGNVNPMSYFQGGFGGFGGQGSNPFSLLGSAESSLSKGSPQASDLLSSTMGGAFTDPTKNPFYSSMAGSATDAAQRLLNKNFDVIGSSLNKAGGGVANTSALPAEMERSAENVSSQLGGTLADIQSKIYGQERGYQNQAMNEGLQLPFELSSALASLAGTGGGIANQFAGTDLSRLGMMGNLGGILQNRTEQGMQFPLDEALKYLSTVRGIPIGASESPFASLLGGFGNLFKGVGALGGAAA